MSVLIRGMDMALEERRRDRIEAARGERCFGCDKPEPPARSSIKCPVYLCARCARACTSQVHSEKP